MPLQNRLHTSAQENILTILAWSDQYGRIVAESVDAQLFEGDLKIIAIKCIEYWRRHKTAPKMHLADLFSDILDTKNPAAIGRANTFRRLLASMHELHQGINIDYVLRTLFIFQRQQEFAIAILQAAEVLNRPSETTIEDVEIILGSILKKRHLIFERGRRLDNIEPMLEFLNQQYNEFPTGVSVFNCNGIVPARGEIFLLLGGKSRGKSWWLVDIGRRALMVGKKVLHITLENSEDETQMRYFQNLFAVSRKFMQSIKIPQMERESEHDKVIGLRMEDVDVDFSFRGIKEVKLRKELQTRIAKVGGRIANLEIKRFANGALSVDGLRGYLDALEAHDNWIPDLLIVDYVKLMKIDIRHLRESYQQNFDGVRQIAVERNMAAATVDQLNRAGYERRQGRSTDVAESWGEIHTADKVVTHAATDAERRGGLARLFVDHARTEEDKFKALITQSLAIGQFCIDSTYMPDKYFDNMMPREESEGD